MTHTDRSEAWERFYNWFVLGIPPGSPSPSSPAQPAEAARPPAADCWQVINPELRQPQMQQMQR